MSWPWPHRAGRWRSSTRYRQCRPGRWRGRRRHPPRERNRLPVLPQRIRQVRRGGGAQPPPARSRRCRSLPGTCARAAGDDAIDREGNGRPDAQEIPQQGAGGCAALVEEEECHPDSATPSPTQPCSGVGSPMTARMSTVKRGTIAISSDEEKGEVRLSPRMNPSGTACSRSARPGQRAPSRIAPPSGRRHFAGPAARRRRARP